VIADDDVIGAKPSVEAKPRVEQPARPDWVPQWVPECLADLWRLDDLDPVRAANRKRFLSDARLKAALEYLMARRKQDGRYRLPAEGFSGIDDQEWAINRIVRSALVLAETKPRVTYQHDVEAAQARRNEVAKRVRALLAAEKDEGFCDDASEMIEEAADMIEEAADATGCGHIIVDRKSDSDEVRGSAMAMARQFALHFGSPCCKLTATFIVVALNVDIKIETLRTRIRDWWKHLEQQERNEAAADGDED
jgi:hypothetical protein